MKTGRYEPIVYRSLSRSLLGIPVLMYHDLKAADFEQDLEHLANNGYRTITADRLLAFLKGAATLAERSLLITLDDGHRSLFEVAWPLLTKFEMCATAFINPGLVGRRDLTGKAAERALCDWDQLVEMDRSGVVRVECHTWDHRQIFICDQVIGFVDGDGNACLDTDRLSALPAGVSVGYPSSSERVTLSDGRGWPDLPPPGYPLFPAGPRFAHGRRYIESTGWGEAVMEQLPRIGGASALSSEEGRLGWVRILEERSVSQDLKGRFEELDERKEAWHDDLTRSMATMEERLGRPPRHLCFPWNVSCSECEELARSLGFATIFGRSGDFGVLNHYGQDPFRIARMNARSGSVSTVLSLPGHGRRGYGRFVLAKLLDRLPLK